MLEYGHHLVCFLNGKTGLSGGKRKDDWGAITKELMEKMASQLYTDGKIKGPGIQDVLNAFNSFESHDICCIDEGNSNNGFGVQLMIVWDGEISDDGSTVVTKPIVPVRTVNVESTTADEEEMMMILENEETTIQVR